MKLEDLTRELAAGTLRPAYLLAGEEPLLRDDALAALRSAALGGGLEAFNFDRIDAASSTPGAVIDAVRTLPVMAPRRLVIVEEPDARRGGARGIADALADLVPDLDAGGPTVLVVLASRPDRRLRWVKAFGSSVVDCEPPQRARDVALFARAEADRQGIALERGVAELLAERTGPQLLMLRQEIAKLGLLAGPSAPVTRAHVTAGTPQVADAPVWDLNDAIAEGRSADAIRVLGHLLASGSARTAGPSADRHNRRAAAGGSERPGLPAPPAVPSRSRAGDPARESHPRCVPRRWRRSDPRRARRPPGASPR